MALEAVYRYEGEAIDYTPAAALTGGQVIQLADGRAAVSPTDLAAGVKGAVQVCGVYRLLKTASIVILDGGKVFWDHSANKAHYKTVNDRDFYVGTAVGDSASSDTTVDVAFNRLPAYLVDINRDPVISATAGTAAAGGFGYPVRLGGSSVLELTATNEAQKVDLLSVDGFAVGANAIVEGAFRVISDGAGTVVDVSLGVANATHTTDADSIAESCFIHLDANNTNINAESDDGTTEVAATDTTLDYTEGSALASRVEFWMDLRDPTDIQIYVNGALVLGSTVFKLDAATGPLFLLAHVEKTSSTDTYKIAVDWLRARIAEQ